jgi:Alginate export
MFAIPRTAKQLALATLLAGVSILAPSTMNAQTPTAENPSEAVREIRTKEGVVLVPNDGISAQVFQATPAELPKIAEPKAAPAVPTPTPITGAQPGCDAASPESPWAKIPSYLRPTPRAGLFWLTPSGPGYYTLLDAAKGDCKDKAPASPYRNCFWENDFRYLDAPDGKPVDCLDSIKRMHLGGFDPYADNWILSIGGEIRVQAKNENDSRLTTTNNRYELLRNRVYADLWYKDEFRVYVEYLDAQSYNQSLPPLAIDIDHSDLLNAFVDMKLGDVDGNPIYFRVGRQELLYGSQRLISTLDWANTRRTFDGAKVFYRSDKLDLDVFYTRPVVVSPSHFDSADWNRQFAGAWATYRPEKGQEIDAYYLYLDSDLKVPFGYVPGGRGGYYINTFGGRYSGDHKLQADACTDHGSFLWDFEAALQCGEWSNRNAFAGMSSTGIGYQATQLPMQPSFWVYYDFASGAANPTGTGTFSDFNQLFPFGHYYFGYLDLVGRENIRDLNFQATAFPTKWMTALAQYHIFTLDEARSPLFGPAPGFPIERSSPTGFAGVNVGQELDLVLNMNLSRHQSLMIGYSKLFEGDFIRKSGPSVSPELMYLQYTIKW